MARIANYSVQFSRSVVSNSATPWITAHQASLSITNSRSLLKLMSIESVMPSSHLILFLPLLLLPPIRSSIRVFSNESTLCMRWPKYWSFSFSISPSNEEPGLISLRMDWLEVNREMQINTVQKYHLIPGRMAIIKKSINNKCWRGCGEKGTLLNCWWECKLVQPLWTTVWRFLKKLKLELPHDPPIPFLGIYLEKAKTLIWKGTHFQMFNTRYNSQDREATLNVHQQMKWQRWSGVYVCLYLYIDTHNGILLSHKKEWNDICNDMDGPRDYHTKWSKWQKDRYHLVLFICGIWKNDTNKLIYKTEIDS